MRHHFPGSFCFIGKTPYKAKTLRVDAHAFAKEACRRSDAKAARYIASDMPWGIIEKFSCGIGLFIRSGCNNYLLMLKLHIPMRKVGK